MSTHLLPGIKLKPVKREAMTKQNNTADSARKTSASIRFFKFMIILIPESTFREGFVIIGEPSLKKLGLV
jgi:hypothetical protein